MGEILWGPQKTSGNEEVHRKGKGTARMDRHLGKGTSVSLLSSIARPYIFRAGRRSLHSQFSFPAQPLPDHSLHRDGFWRQTCLVTQNLDSTIYDLNLLSGAQSLLMLHSHATDFSVFHRAALQHIFKLALMQEVGPKDGIGYLLESKERRYRYQYSGPDTPPLALAFMLLACWPFCICWFFVLSTVSILILTAFWDTTDRSKSITSI